MQDLRCKERQNYIFSQRLYLFCGIFFLGLLWPLMIFAEGAPGSLKWKFTVSGIPQESAVSSDGTVYLAHETGLYAINPDGTQKWELKLSGYKLGPVLDEARQTIYVYNSNLYAINYDGSIKWVKNLSELAGVNGACIKTKISGIEVGPDGTIYLGVRPILIAVDPSGVKKWVFRQSPDSWQFFYRPAVSPDGTIYSGSDDGNLYAVDTNGNEKWHFPADGEDIFQPAVTADGQVIYFTTNGDLYALQVNGSLKWKIHVGGPLGSPVIGDDETIYVLGYGLHAYDTNGNEKWHVDYVSGNDFTPSLHDHLIYFAQGSAGLYCFDTNGNQKWLYPLDSPYTVATHCPVDSAGHIFVTSNKDGSLHSVNSAGHKIWSFETKGAPIYQSPAIDHAGNIYLSADNGWLYKLDKNGGLLWKQYKGDGLSPTIGADNTVYIGSSSHVVYAINPNGSEKCEFRTADYYNSSPSVDSAGNLYFTSSSFGFAGRQMTLHAITSNGNKIWTANLGDVYDKLSLPAIGNDRTIYVVNGKSDLLAFSADGVMKWKYTSGLDTLRPADPIIGSNGQIFYKAKYRTNDGPLISVNANGDVNWSHSDHNGELEEFSVGIGGTLFSGGTKFYAISASNGTTLWQADVSNEALRFSAPAIGEDGTLYSGSGAGYLYAFSSSGTVKWKFDAESTIYAPPTLASDGTLYFGNVFGTLFALNTNSAGPADTSWPMYRSNAQHTGGKWELAPGDVNGDGDLNIIDALLVARNAVGLSVGNFNADAADVNCDGNADIIDALLIARKAVGLSVSGWCGE